MSLKPFRRIYDKMAAKYYDKIASFNNKKNNKQNSMTKWNEDEINEIIRL